MNNQEISISFDTIKEMGNIEQVMRIEEKVIELNTEAGEQLNK